MSQRDGDSGCCEGTGGVEAAYAPAGNSISRVDLGPLDTVAPNALNTQTLDSYITPTEVDFQWQGIADDPIGTGVAYYELYKNGAWDGNSYEPSISDPTLSSGTTYTFAINAVDYHWNVSSTSFTITTPPAGDIDARQVGVRPLGTYWGYGGEQIDMRSGNLNYSVPLVKALGRGGWGVGFNLTYNSQNWRQDPGGVWKLGRDVGYGYGWKLLAGSLLPVYDGYFTPVHHYVFTDSTGAEYRLDQNNSGVWSSLQSLYVYYDSNAGRLYFRDGSDRPRGIWFPLQFVFKMRRQYLITLQQFRSVR